MTEEEAERIEREREEAGEICTCDYYPESCAVHHDTWYL